jgi:hypothetical protein
MPSGDVSRALRVPLTRLAQHAPRQPESAGEVHDTADPEHDRATELLIVER